MARPMIKEAGMASLLLENPYYILLLSFKFIAPFFFLSINVVALSKYKIVQENYLSLYASCHHLFLD